MNKTAPFPLTLRISRFILITRERGEGNFSPPTMRRRVFLLLLCVACLTIALISPESEAKPKSDDGPSPTKWELCGCVASHPPGVLKEFFPDLNFERVWIFTSGLLTPLMHCFCIEGMAIDHCILIRPEHSLGTPYGLGIIAHELKHVEQWQEMGMIGFAYGYSLECIRNCYLNNKYEKEAREIQGLVEEEMMP